MIQKTELLKAMRRILREYKKNEHHAHLDHCALCGMFNQNSNLFNGEKDKVERGHQCKKCPMVAFRIPNDSNYTYPCMNRKCEPINCDGVETRDSQELKAVVEFYKQVIKAVALLSEEDLNKKNAFKFLIQIDNNAS